MSRFVPKKQTKYPIASHRCTRCKRAIQEPPLCGPCEKQLDKELLAEFPDE